MNLPPIANPKLYVGLYVYDFKTHVSVGYTALEIRYLRESEAHGHGMAYEIYRVTEQGGLELRGAPDDRLAAREAMCFLRMKAEAARRDFDGLSRLAYLTPVPCPAELQLAKVRSFDPPNVSALLYPASAGHAMAHWLNRTGFTGGDQVLGGIDVHARFMSAEAERIDSRDLPTAINYTDRSPEEVLRTVRRPLQR